MVVVHRNEKKNKREDVIKCRLLSKVILSKHNLKEEEEETKQDKTRQDKEERSISLSFIHLFIHSSIHTHTHTHTHTRLVHPTPSKSTARVYLQRPPRVVDDDHGLRDVPLRVELVEGECRGQVRPLPLHHLVPPHTAVVAVRWGRGGRRG